MLSTQNGIRNEKRACDSPWFSTDAAGRVIGPDRIAMLQD